MAGMKVLSRRMSLALAAVASLVARPAGAEVLTLARAIEIGRRAAPETRAARAAAAAEVAQERVAKAAYFPTLGTNVAGQLSGQLTTQPLPPPSTGLFPYVSYARAGQGSANLQWTLWDFGKTLGAVRNADAQRVNAERTVEATDLVVIGNVATAYINLAFAERVRDVTKDTVNQRERISEIAKALTAAGLQPPLEQLREAGRAEAARHTLATAEGSVADARAVLAALLGIPSNGSWQVAIPHLRHPEITPNAAMADATRLPSVRASEATVDQYRGALMSAKAQFLPTLGLAANFFYNFTKFDTVQETERTRGASATMSLSIPIFNLAYPSGVAAQRANVENAASNADVTRRNAQEEAARAVAAVASARAMLKYARTAAEDAANVLAIVQSRYVKGVSTPLELLDAEGADDAARLTVATDELNEAVQVIRLYVATGRKLDDE